MSNDRPHRRRLDFHSFEEILNDVEHLHRVGYKRLGKWDLSQILDHLGEGARTAVKGSNRKGPWILRKVIGPLLISYTRKTRRMKANIKVPKWWLPGPAHDESKAIEKFRSDLKSFEYFKGSTHGHPLLGAMDKAAWNDIIQIHSSHHLSFLIPNDAK
jgi:hypothetical protein